MKSIFTLVIFCSLLISSSFIAQVSEKNPINKKMIESAEGIIGLEFTDAERDSMLSDLYDNLNSYKYIHEFGLDNSVMPAVQFNPIPVGFEFPEGESEIMLSDYSDTKMPDDEDELAFYSIGQLGHLIKTKQISSVELTRFFIDRLEEYGPKLECVITLTEDFALARARKCDGEIAAGNYKGPLHGIPFGIKDLLSTEKFKTTWGATPYKDQIINENSTVVNKLTEAGGVMVAKLTLGALAWGDVWYDGKTKNPWDITKGSSGSSAGSASATAAGLVPFAIGTETWGSIVSPSTICGTTGLRPTYGRVSRKGAMALSWTMDKIGPITRSAEDLAIVFHTIYGPDNVDQTLYDVPFNYSPEIDFSQLKIGYLKSDFDDDYGFKQNDSLALEKLRELGAELIPIEFPEIDVYNLAFVLSAEAAAAFDELTRSNKDDLLIRQMKNAWPNVFRMARLIPAVEYINANRIRNILINKMQEVMSEFDLYIAPSWNGSNLLLTNLTGHPCVVVPTGFNEDGSLSSITFMGRLFDEGRLIAFAKKYQDASGHHLNHPDLSRID